MATSPVVREESSAVARRRLTKDERRARIMTAAAGVFAERGYDAASLDEIAEAAGISKPVIYDHFESKRELHISLLDSHFEEFLAFMSERVVGGSTPEERLARGFDAFLEFVENHPYAWRLVFRDPVAADIEIMRAHERMRQRTTTAIAALRGGRPGSKTEFDGLDREASVELLAQMIKTAGNGVAAWWYEHRDVPREKLVQAMMGFAWLGLERCESGERWRRGEGA
jgi:AcrR family transcriptional regulator